MVSEHAEITWSRGNRIYAEEYGVPFTKIGDIAHIPVDRLRPYSNELVLMECDYCGEIIERQYQEYYRRVLNGKTKKVACANSACAAQKALESKGIPYLSPEELFQLHITEQKNAAEIAIAKGLDRRTVHR